VPFRATGGRNVRGTERRESFRVRIIALLTVLLSVLLNVLLAKTVPGCAIRKPVARVP